MNFNKTKSMLKLMTPGPKRPEQMAVEKKLASHVPDLVVFNQNRDNIPHILQFNAVLLFADVSGFTALTEKYTLFSEKGTDALTVTLNSYIGKIVKYILQSGGDVLKFAGDAILAAWKVKTRSDLKFAITQVARCSLIIQDQCDKQDTEVGVQLRVKIAISAGKTYATFVGNNMSQHIMMSGRPVREVNAAEKYCKAGTVVLSPNAMELSDKEILITTDLENRFALVNYLRREPKRHWDQYIDYPFYTIENPKSVKYKRLALNYPPDINREHFIRKYVAAVVQKKLDDDQPLNFLSEMRQCSIIFINLDFDLNENDRLFYEKQSSTMQTVFSIIYKNTIEKQGAINKIFMFDKGCTFLIIFGLPGDKHEQEPAHALQVSWKISQELHRDVSSLILLSFGITTGPVFCGVVGHEERHEYTVIGQKVNLAARLMIYYPNLISCDFETYHDSKLSKEMFTKLPQKALKGIGCVTVFKYTEGTRKSFSGRIIHEPKFPIIGRAAEVDLFKKEITRVKLSQKSNEEKILIFEGEAGYGKTRLMKEIEWCASKDGFRVISYMLSITDVSIPYFAIKALLAILLRSYSSNFKIYKSKEHRLLDMLGTSNSRLLCLLNELLDVSFPISSRVIEMPESQKIATAHELLRSLMDSFSSDCFVLFSLDDAHNIDAASWEYLLTLCHSPKVLTVIALRPFSPDKPPSKEAKQVMHHPNTTFVKLTPLLNDDLYPLACQFLRVKKIPNDLIATLIQRSHGVPLWCEHLLREMQNAGILQIVPQVKEGGDQLGIIHTKAPVDTSKSQFLTEKVFNIFKKSPLTPARSPKVVPVNADESTHKNDSQDSLVDCPMECLIKKNFNLSKFPVPASMRGMALARLDRMKSFEQVLVKSAAVIGSCCSRKMLKAIVPGFGEKKFRQAIYQLMLSHVFECASKLNMEKVDLPKRQTGHVSGRSYRLTCYCNTDYGDLSEEAIAAKCEQFRFHNSLLKETAYKLWLQDQRKTLHESCADYLEAKVNEILTTNQADPVVSKQYRLLLNYSLYEQLSRSKESLLRTGFEKIPLKQPSSLNLSHRMSNSSNISAPGKIFSEEQSSEDYSISYQMKHFQNLPGVNHHRISLISAPDKLADEASTPLSLDFKEQIPPILGIASSARSTLSEAVTESKNTPSGTNVSPFQFHHKKIGNESAWIKSLKVSPEYETVTRVSERQARDLPVTTSMCLHQNSFQIHDSLVLFYQQLVHHWRNAKHTTKTLYYLLKTAESQIATRALSYALLYLQIAEDIVGSLEKGYDLVANLTQSDDPYDENKTVIPRIETVTKARIQKLMGQAFYQQGNFEESLIHFKKALKILNCNIPTTAVGIVCSIMYESYFQRLHMKNPSKYIGNVAYTVGCQYVEQVQCLAYMWQLLNKLKKVRYRNFLSRLVVFKQVNRAESSDYDFQRLIISYIYMTQFWWFKGDLLKSALYEQKAFAKCSQLSNHPTTSDLYIISHMHLVSASYRLCHGNLESALTAAYRAYNITTLMQDIDMKLILLPLMAEMHLLTGRGRSCVETLMCLRQTVKSCSNVGNFSYHLCCFNIILDGGYALETSSVCTEYLEDVDIADIGEVQMFCALSSLALWYSRLNDYKAKDWLKLAWQARSISYESYFAVLGYCRLVEAHLLQMHRLKNVERSLEFSKTEIILQQVIKRLKRLCRKFPVFYARLLHYQAYHKCLHRKMKEAADYLTQSIEFAESCGNLIDHQWASHSKMVWLGNMAAANIQGGYWMSNFSSMPPWESARLRNDIDRSFILKIK